MTLRIHTARITYRGADRLDITRKSAPPEGMPFAPSWAILGPALKARKEGREDWPSYVAAYTAEMRASYQQKRTAWDALLARGEVTLCCYCTDGDRCHRRILAGILTKLGAIDEGERTT